MKAVVRTTVSSPFDFFESRAAISISPIEKAEVEVGDTFDVQGLTNNLAAQSYDWFLDNKAFKTGYTLDQYTSADLLYEELDDQCFFTRYITGDLVSGVPGTDLGQRTIWLTIPNLPTAVYPIETLVKQTSEHGKITFYHVPYEVNTGYAGGTVETIITNGPPNRIYLVGSFAAAADTNGTGRIHRIRTSSTMAKGEGTIPTAAQRYIHFEGWNTQENLRRFHFQSDVRGALGTTLEHQDAAKYYYHLALPTPTPIPPTPPPTPVPTAYHYSYYNFSGYEVTGLQDYITEKKSQMTLEAEPEDSSSDAISVEDRGPFAFGGSRLVDQKHLDIFMEPENENGIHPNNMLRLGTTFREVRK